MSKRREKSDREKKVLNLMANQIPEKRIKPSLSERLHIKGTRLVLTFSVTVIVLLVLVTLATTGILEGLATQVMNDHSIFGFCERSGISIWRANYDRGSDELTVYVHNNGDVPLTGFVVNVEYTGNYMTVTDLDWLTVPQNDVELVAIKAEKNIESVSVRSIECEGTVTSMKRNEIRGFQII